LATGFWPGGALAGREFALQRQLEGTRQHGQLPAIEKAKANQDAKAFEGTLHSSHSTTVWHTKIQDLPTTSYNILQHPATLRKNVQECALSGKTLL